MEITPFYIFLFIHLASLLVGFGAVIVIDTFGLLWMLGKKTLVDVNKVANVTQVLIWIGWTGLVLSGSGLLYNKGFIDNLTWIKLFLVAMVGVNGVFLHTIKKQMDKLGAITELPRPLFFKISLASTISQIGWWGAILIGFVHRHIESYIPWPGNPFAIIGLLASIILLVAICGTVITRQSKQHLNAVI